MNACQSCMRCMRQHRTLLAPVLCIQSTVQPRSGTHSCSAAEHHRTVWCTRVCAAAERPRTVWHTRVCTAAERLVHLQFGGRLNWDAKAICGDDRNFRGQGNPSTGDFFHAAPNVDHTQEFVREGICEWLNWLRTNIGIDGYRLDFARGFSGALHTIPARHARQSCVPMPTAGAPHLRACAPRCQAACCRGSSWPGELLSGSAATAGSHPALWLCCGCCTCRTQETLCGALHAGHLCVACRQLCEGVLRAHEPRLCGGRVLGQPELRAWSCHVLPEPPPSADHQLDQRGWRPGHRV
jgi:hypothetical protein